MINQGKIYQEKEKAKNQENINLAFKFLNSNIDIKNFKTHEKVVNNFSETGLKIFTVCDRIQILFIFFRKGLIT